MLKINKNIFKSSALIIFSVLILFTYCKEEPVKPKPKAEIEPIEPELIRIDEDLTFTYLLFRSEEKDVYKPKEKITVTLEPYYIGKYELTNLEFYQFFRDGGYSDQDVWSEKGWDWRVNYNVKKPEFWILDLRPAFKYDPHSNKNDTPVHCISFYEAEAYCNWLSKKTGKEYCIPTSAQWQRAAKGPDPGYLYPWGNELIEENFHYIYENLDFILLPVNSYPQGVSPDGCFHMVGNVYEYAIPIIKHFDKSKYMALYSYPDFLQSSTYGLKLSMTVKGVLPLEASSRSPAYGLRICRYIN